MDSDSAVAAANEDSSQSVTCDGWRLLHHCIAPSYSSHLPTRLHDDCETICKLEHFDIPQPRNLLILHNLNTAHEPHTHPPLLPTHHHPVLLLILSLSLPPLLHSSFPSIPSFGSLPHTKPLTPGPAHDYDEPDSTPQRLGEDCQKPNSQHTTPHSPVPPSYRPPLRSDSMARQSHFIWHLL